jgi:hypothetical protein
VTSHSSLKEQTSPLFSAETPLGFSSMLRAPDGHRVRLKNVKLSRESESSNRWLLETLPLESEEAGWTEHIFDGGGGHDVFYRGPLLFVSMPESGRDQWIERRDTAAATAFANGKERSMLDLRHYICGQREDGAIVYQSDVIVG